MLQDTSDIVAMYPWLTTELFTRILQKDFPDNVVHVQKYSVKAALAKGENFASQMLRATVTYKIGTDDSPRDVRLIIKATLDNMNARAVLDEKEMFLREIVSFEYILPSVHKLLQSVGDHTKLSAA